MNRIRLICLLLLTLLPGLAARSQEKEGEHQAVEIDYENPRQYVIGGVDVVGAHSI